ncbi:AAA family ATPase [Streptomyces cucumeris]|uniref:AAA family ATPase n=1 Tax=Streptomyces cucumeris TaxID=2962890 RepID=UPI003D706744
MRRIARVKIEGLFGYVNHDVEFSRDTTTIISGPNGIGKTHFLRLVHALLTLDLGTLASVDFKKIEIHFIDKYAMKVEQKWQAGDISVFRISERNPQARNFKGVDVPYSKDAEEVRELPPHLVRLPDGSVYDMRMDRPLSPDFAQRRYGISPVPSAASHFGNSWLGDFFKSADAILVDTQRLDISPNYRGGAQTSASSPRQGPVITRIRQYIDQVAAQLSDARRASLNESLKADQTFAARVLKKARTTINEKDLKERYQRIADQHAELHASGMSVRPVDVEFPREKTTPTERRILNVFLDDWERKLLPLLPIHEKLKALRRIVESKFIGKELLLNSRGYVRFRSTVSGKPLAVNSLSSGEQHLLALFTMLLFAADEGGLILIDEPEISMHAAWKHTFLDDVAEVARLSNLQIVLATHSSAIINGQWELVQEIAMPQLSQSDVQHAEEFDDLESEV